MNAKDTKKVAYYKREILRLFLTIYINHIKKYLKLREIPHYESDFHFVKKQGSYENYELKVLIGENNYSRTMSIRLLAEGSSAKSLVFEIIYDIHIVIKIPPVKITDFDEYLRKVMHEKTVIGYLEDQIVTIVPEFQCILKMIFPLGETVGLANNKRIEKMYEKLLTKDPRLHRFLQLDGGYVFFMYLSRNRTLGDFIRQIYNKDELVEREIRENESIFWDAQSFQGRYEFNENKDIEPDSELDHLFYKYNEAFDFIDSYLKSVMRNEYKIKIETYQTRQWFIDYLSHQEVDINSADYPDGFLQTLTIAFKYIIHNYSETFDKFFQVIKTYSEKRRYTYNKEKLRIICSNLLVIFTILFQKKVSHRDLKPDNIIIVANNFERSEMVKSEIGLIDFETAHAARLDDNLETIGGTPQYATLSQLYNSRVLAEVYGEAYKDIYNYQDLYALVAIIYQLFTGKPLFIRTGSFFKQSFSDISKDDALATGDGYIKLSKNFWAIAFEELKDRLEAEEDRLKLFEVQLKMNDMSSFLATFFQPQHVENKLKDLETAQSGILEKQTIFKEDQVTILKEADTDKIAGLIKKNAKKGLHDHLALLENMKRLKENIGFFHSIKQLKENMDNYQEFRMRLSNDEFDEEEKEIFEIQVAKQKESIEERPGINVYDLLKAFFDMAYNNMYYREWGALPLDGSIDTDKNADLEFQATL